MKILITVEEAINKGIWTGICEIKGINEWAIKPGSIDIHEKIELTEEEARGLGLINKEAK